MELINLDHAAIVQDLLELEYGVALFYMRYVAFGFTFSGSMDQLMNLMEEINQLQGLWGYMHRN